jgi:hypothetical protein
VAKAEAPGSGTTVAHQRDALARRKHRDQLLHAGGFIVCVQRYRGSGYSVVAEQGRGHSRVLRRDHTGGRQHIECAQCQIAQIPERRRHHI